MLFREILEDSAGAETVRARRIPFPAAVESEHSDQQRLDDCRGGTDAETKGHQDGERKRFPGRRAEGQPMSRKIPSSARATLRRLLVRRLRRIRRAGTTEPTTCRQHHPVARTQFVAEIEADILVIQVAHDDRGYRSGAEATTALERRNDHRLVAGAGQTHAPPQALPMAAASSSAFMPARVTAEASRPPVPAFILWAAIGRTYDLSCRRSSVAYTAPMAISRPACSPIFARGCACRNPPFQGGQQPAGRFPPALQMRRGSSHLSTIEKITSRHLCGFLNFDLS